MNILITGATGFIGKNIVKSLINDGHFCRCLVRRTDNLDDIFLNERVELFLGDISRKETLSDICKDIDIVINSAGILAKWDSTIDDLRPVNSNGIINLSFEIIKHKVKYVVHLSAGGVTGPVRGAPADETYKCSPVTPYEKTKLEGEINALDLYKNKQVPIVVVRPTFTYGPQDPHKLPLFRAVKKRHFVFIGSGTSVNHPVYIDDLVNGIMLLLKKRIVGTIFILGGPKLVTKKEMIQTIALELGVSDKFIHFPVWFARFSSFFLVLLSNLFGLEPILTPSRVSMMADNWGYSIQKAKKEIGYNPQVDLSAGIHKTAQSYKKNQWL